MASLIEYSKITSQELVKRLMQKYQVSTIKQCCCSLVKLNADRTEGVLADGTTTDIQPQGLPGDYALSCKLHGGLNLARRQEPIQYSAHGGQGITGWDFAFRDLRQNRNSPFFAGAVVDTSLDLSQVDMTLEVRNSATNGVITTTVNNHSTTSEIGVLRYELDDFYQNLYINKCNIIRNGPESVSRQGFAGLPSVSACGNHLCLVGFNYKVHPQYQDFNTELKVYVLILKNLILDSKPHPRIPTSGTLRAESYSETFIPLHQFFTVEDPVDPSTAIFDPVISYPAYVGGSPISDSSSNPVACSDNEDSSKATVVHTWVHSPDFPILEQVLYSVSGTIVIANFGTNESDEPVADLVIVGDAHKEQHRILRLESERAYGTDNFNCAGYINPWYTGKREDYYFSGGPNGPGDGVNKNSFDHLTTFAYGPFTHPEGYTYPYDGPTGFGFPYQLDGDARWNNYPLSMTVTNNSGDGDGPYPNMPSELPVFNQSSEYLGFAVHLGLKFPDGSDLGNFNDEIDWEKPDFYSDRSLNTALASPAPFFEVVNRNCSSRTISSSPGSFYNCTRGSTTFPTTEDVVLLSGSRAVYAAAIRPLHSSLALPLNYADPGPGNRGQPYIHPSWPNYFINSGGRDPGVGDPSTSSDDYPPVQYPTVVSEGLIGDYCMTATRSYYLDCASMAAIGCRTYVNRSYSGPNSTGTEFNTSTALEQLHAYISGYISLSTYKFFGNIRQVTTGEEYISSDVIFSGCDLTPSSLAQTELIANDPRCYAQRSVTNPNPVSGQGGLINSVPFITNHTDTVNQTDSHWIGVFKNIHGGTFEVSSVQDITTFPEEIEQAYFGSAYASGSEPYQYLYKGVRFTTLLGSHNLNYAGSRPDDFYMVLGGDYLTILQQFEYSASPWADCHIPNPFEEVYDQFDIPETAKILNPNLDQDTFTYFTAPGLVDDGAGNFKFLSRFEPDLMDLVSDSPYPGLYCQYNGNEPTLTPFAWGWAYDINTWIVGQYLTDPDSPVDNNGKALTTGLRYWKVKWNPESGDFTKSVITTVSSEKWALTKLPYVPSSQFLFWEINSVGSFIPFVKDT